MDLDAMERDAKKWHSNDVDDWLPAGTICCTKHVPALVAEVRRLLDMTEQNRRRGVYTAAADDCPDCGAPFRVESCGRRCDRCGYLLMRGK